MTAQLLKFPYLRIRPIESHEAKILVMPIKKALDDWTALWLTMAFPWLN